MKAVPTYFSSLLAPTPMDESTSSYDWNEYKTSDLNISSGNQQTSSRYQITVKDTDSYLLLSQSYLLVRFKLLDAAGADVANQIVTLAAGAAGLFARIELLGNDSQIDLCDNPHYVQLLTALLDYNRDKLETVSHAEWLQLDFADEVGALRSGTADLVTPELSAVQFDGSPVQTWQHGSGCAVVKEYVEHTDGDDSVGAPHPNFNRGFMMRFQRTKNEREAEVAIPLQSVLGYCRDIKSVSRGIKFELNMDKNLAYDEILHGAQVYVPAANPDPARGDEVKFSTLIKKISWWIPQVTPSLIQQRELENMLDSTVISKQYFENLTCRPSGDVFPAGTVDAEIILNLEGHKPSKIFIAAQRVAQYNTTCDPLVLSPAGATINRVQLMDQTHANGSTFSYLGRYDPANNGAADVTGGITEASLRINNRSLPREPYRTNFGDASPEFMRVYCDFLKASGKYFDGDGAALTPEQWRSLYPIFAFDLRDYSADIFSGVKQNDVRFRLRVASGSPSAFRLVYVIFSEREMVLQPINGKLSLKV